MGKGFSRQNFLRIGLKFCPHPGTMVEYFKSTCYIVLVLFSTCIQFTTVYLYHCTVCIQTVLYCSVLPQYSQVPLTRNGYGITEVTEKKDLNFQIHLVWELCTEERMCFFCSTKLHAITELVRFFGESTARFEDRGDSRKIIPHCYGSTSYHSRGYACV